MKWIYLLLVWMFMGCSTSTNAGGSIRDKLVVKAQSYLGTRYTVDGKSPASGFDCSGFVTYVFNQFDFHLTGGSTDIAKQGINISKEKVKKGDLVFFGTPKEITHVGIVVERSKNGIFMIHSSSQVGISIENITTSEYWRGKFLFAKVLIN